MTANHNESSDLLHDVIENTNANFKTIVGNKYSIREIRTIWGTLSQWIRQSLLQNKAVHIKDFGEFTISKWQLYVGLIHPIEVQQPVFILSQKLSNFFHLKKVKIYTSSKIPQQLINYTIIAKLCNRDRYTVETCITEVKEAFARLLSEDKDLILKFEGVGELVIRRKKVKFTFEEDLLNS